MIIPTIHETKVNYTRLKENPLLVKGLTDIQYHEVTKLIKQQIDSGSILIARMMSIDTNNPEDIRIQENIHIGIHRRFLQQLEQIRNDTPEPKDELLFNTDFEKIVLLHEFGFFEFCLKKYGENNPKQIHNLVYQITGISSASVKKSLQRISVNDSKNLPNHIKKAKLMIGEVKPTNEVLKNNK